MEGKVQWSSMVVLAFTEYIENAIIKDKNETCFSYSLEEGLYAYWKIQKFPKLRSFQRSYEQMNVSFLIQGMLFLLCLFVFVNFCEVKLQLD